MNETKKCKHCQSDIPKQAKVCPNCRKKQGGIGVWIIIAIVVFIIIGAFGSGDETPTKVDDSKNTENASSNSSTEQDPTSDTFKVGDTVEYKGVKITLDSIKESTGSQYNTPGEGKVFILATFTIENNTDSDLSVSSLMSFTAYQDGYATNYSLTAMLEKDGEQLDGTIAPGKKMKGSVGYEIPADYSEFEINYQSDIANDQKICFVYTKTTK